MKKATLDISPELLVDLFSNEGYERNFTIKANALPDDARIIYCRWIDETGTGGCVRLLIESETFEDVPDGVQPPQLTPVVSTITGAIRSAYERAAQTVEAAESQARLPEIGLHYKVMAAAIRALKGEG